MRPLRRLWSRRGFTLIELVAVMAIIGILAAIVVPAVSGPQQTSKDAEVKEGGFTVQSSAGDFFATQEQSEVIEPLTVSINADINTDTNKTATSTQKKSSRWPEKYLTASSTVGGGYALEFRTATTTINSRVRAVNITDLDGVAISRSRLLTKFTAVDFGVLTGTDKSDARSAPYLTKEPKGVDVLSDGEFHNFLWLFEKISSNQGTDDGRKTAVFKLITVEIDEENADPKPVVLTYRQIF